MDTWFFKLFMSAKYIHTYMYVCAPRLLKTAYMKYALLPIKQKLQLSILFT